MSKPVISYRSDNGCIYPTEAEANQADVRYREYLRGPIPVNVLKRRGGKPKRYRLWRGFYWGSSDLSGVLETYEVEYHGKAKPYWVHHDMHSGGGKPAYDRWTIHEGRKNIPTNGDVTGRTPGAWRDIVL